jgi:hypothetical protein
MQSNVECQSWILPRKQPWDQNHMSSAGYRKKLPQSLNKSEYHRLKCGQLDLPLIQTNFQT